MVRNLVLVLAVTTASRAGAESVFIAPTNEDTPGAAALNRAVETAVLEKMPKVSVVTPRSLDQKLELDVMRACQGGDDGQCVTQFADSLGVDYILRPALSRLGDVQLFTLTLYDGKRAVVVAQGQRKATEGDEGKLLDEIPGLVVEVGRKGGLPVKIEQPRPFPVIPLAAILGGTGALVVGGAAIAGCVAVESQYQAAELSRDQAGTWEGGRFVAYPVAGALTLAGVVLAGYGVFALVRE